MKKPSVVVVGAGIGGLAVAIKLAQAGMAVTIFEKNNRPGGRCQQIIKGKHRFDTGPTMYLFPDLFADFFESIGENIGDHLTLLRSDPAYRLNFADGRHLLLTPDLKKMRQQLEKIERGSYRQYVKFLAAGKTFYRLTMEMMVKKNFRYPWEYFNPVNLYFLLRHRALANHVRYVGQFFRHPHLLAAFTFQDSYISLNPFRAPAICSVFPYAEHVAGNFLPQGGMFQVIRALVTIAKKNGVKIIYNSAVKKITVKNKRVTGVVLSDRSKVLADYVVVNCDLPYAYDRLLPKNGDAKKLLTKKYSSSAMVFHWGTDKKYKQLAANNLFFIDPYKEPYFQVLDEKEPPANTHFYIQAPSRTDSSRAPAGGDTFTVFIPINHLYSDHPVDWKRYQKHIREKVFLRLEKTGLRDIRRHIKFEISFTPPDWHKYFNLTYGAVYGLHHDFMQQGYLRPSRQHKNYKNLFFTGADTHPGSGLPTVLQSARFTAELLVNS